jgi:hypothetical protein
MSYPVLRTPVAEQRGGIIRLAQIVQVLERRVGAHEEEMSAALRRHDPGKLRPVELHIFSAGELRHKESAPDGASVSPSGLVKL